MRIEGRKRPGAFYRDWIEIEHEASAWGAVYLRLRVRLLERTNPRDSSDFSSFCAEVSMGVERSRWERFLAQLELLVRTRSSEASVHCVNGPETTKLVFFATEPPLHRFGLRGRLHSARTGDDALGGPGEARLDFPALHLDRAELERILGELRAFR